MAYAEGTTVTPERSQQEISATLRKYGAQSFAYGWDDNRAMIQFVAHERQIRFLLDLPHPDDKAFKTTSTGRSRTNPQSAYEGEIRRRWRALNLAIKAKLESVETGIATFEEEFMAHIVMPDGKTVAEHLVPKIEAAYRTGGMPPSLLAIEGRA
jgi:hypothetical protein